MFFGVLGVLLGVFVVFLAYLLFFGVLGVLLGVLGVMVFLLANHWHTWCILAYLV